jgi:hypothetical protein
MNLLNELKSKSLIEGKELLVKRYLLACCEKLKRFRSGDRLTDNLEIAKKFLTGVANKKQMHRAAWEIEGYAFGTEYYSYRPIRFYFRANKNVRSDLKKVQISKGLRNNEAREYLVEMAYFIDVVFCHVEYSSNWLFKEKDEKFLCPKLYKRYFQQWA